MVAKKEVKINFEFMSYMFGIISIVLAFFTPIAGLIFGLVGITQSKKQKTELSKKARKLNIIGVILSLVFFILGIAVMFFLKNSPQFVSNFG